MTRLHLCTITNKCAANAKYIAFSDQEDKARWETSGLFSWGTDRVIIVWIGTAAAVASTVSFTPQAWKIIKTAETKDISAGMYFITVAAFALWTVYGILLRQWPLVASNVICFFLSGFILTMKLLPRVGKRKVREKVEGTLH